MIVKQLHGVLLSRVVLIVIRNVMIYLNCSLIHLFINILVMKVFVNTCKGARINFSVWFDNKMTLSQLQMGILNKSYSFAVLNLGDSFDTPIRS